MEKSAEKLRINPRLSFYKNLDRVTTNGDFEVTFHLRRPQPAFLMLIAGGVSPVYPCHVPPEKMRRQPIGTGPFKFVDYKANQYIKVTRNPHYWKPGRPYLDGIEYTIIKNVATAMLGFTAGNFDLTFPYSMTIPVMKDVKRQAPAAMCEVTPGTVNRHLLDQPDHPAVRQPRRAAGDGTGARPPGLHRHPRRGSGRHRRRPAAAARRTVGHAARHAEGPAGLWRRREDRTASRAAR